MRTNPRRAARLLAPLIAGALLLAGCGIEQAGTPVADTAGLADLDSSTNEPPNPTSGPDTVIPAPSTTASAPETSTSQTSTPQTSTSQTPPSTTPSTGATASGPAGDLKFGATYTWSNGLAVSVQPPRVYRPSKQDSGRGKEFVTLDIRLTNGNRTLAYLYDGSHLIKDLRSGGQSARQIVDITLPDRPRIALAPGQSATWSEAYGVASAKELTFKYALSDDPPVTFATNGTLDGGKQSGPPGADFEPFVGIQKFGQTYTFRSGLTVKVAPGKSFQPSETARVPVAKQYLQYDLTVVNGGRETLDPYLLTYGLSENGRQLESLVDSRQQIDVRPKGRIPPGSSFTLKVAFGVTGSKNLVVDVRLRENPPVIFTDIAVPTYSKAEPPPDGEPGSTPSTAPPTSTQAPSTAVVDADVAVTGAPEVVFGSTVSWKNGVTVSMSAPQKTTTTSLGRHPDGTTAVRSELTVSNGSTEPLTSFVHVEAASKGQLADLLIDSQSGIGDADVSVEPGTKATVTVGFWAVDPADMLVEVRPDAPYTEGYFSSGAPHKPAKFTPTGGDDDPAVIKFGQPFTTEAGVTVSATMAAATPVGKAAGDENSWVAITGTLTNNSGEPVDFSWYPSVLSGNTKSDTFTNPTEGIGINGLRTVLPGRSLSITAGYIVKDPKEVTAQYRPPDFDDPRVVWTT